MTRRHTTVHDKGCPSVAAVDRGTVAGCGVGQHDMYNLHSLPLQILTNNEQSILMRSWVTMIDVR
jgi:hypothetical protein